MSNPSFTSSSSLAVALRGTDHPPAPRPNQQVEQQVEQQTGRDSTLAGESPGIRRLRSQVQRIAPHFRTALLRGEPGTGKQHVARAIHALSPAAHGPFVVANATALAGAIAEKPSVSNAGSALFEAARDGILYLEAIGELSPGLQATLFRFLRSSEDRRTLRSAKGRAFPRILAETHRDLRTAAATGQFRQDLYALLSVVYLEVPTLRHRTEDLPLIAAHILRRIALKTRTQPSTLAPETIVRIRDYTWPGNLAELERSLTQAAALAESGIIEPRHLLAIAEAAPAPAISPLPLKAERLHDVVQAHVLKVLTRCAGNKLRAAELLGISRSTLYRMLDATSVTT